MSEFKTYKRKGDPARTIVVTSTELHDRLNTAAVRHQTNMSEIVRVVIGEWLDKDEARQQDPR